MSNLLGNFVTLQIGPETVDKHKQRAKIHPEGGVGYETYVPGVGWVVEEDLVNPLLEKITVKVRDYLQSEGYIH